MREVEEPGRELTINVHNLLLVVDIIFILPKRLVKGEIWWSSLTMFGLFIRISSLANVIAKPVGRKGLANGFQQDSKPILQ